MCRSCLNWNCEGIFACFPVRAWVLLQCSFPIRILQLEKAELQQGSFCGFKIAPVLLEINHASSKKDRYQVRCR